MPTMAGSKAGLQVMGAGEPASHLLTALRRMGPALHRGNTAELHINRMTFQLHGNDQRQERSTPGKKDVPGGAFTTSVPQPYCI